MPCGSCVDKLAKKLMSHHKIDMIRAFEFAEKGVERVENRDAQIFSGIGNPTDYSKVCSVGTCVASEAACIMSGEYCTIASDCVGGNCSVSGACGCPAPLANSHQVSPCTVGCSVTGTCAKCLAHMCFPTCLATCAAGTCGYNCDTGYIWNPVTLKCELPVTAKQIIMDGFVLIT